MRGRSGSITLIRFCDLDTAIRHREALYHASEQFQCCFGLVIRHLMSGFIHTCETEITVLSRFSVLDIVDYEWRIPCRSELFRVRVVDFKGDGFAAKPVTNVILL